MGEGSESENSLPYLSFHKLAKHPCQCPMALVMVRLVSALKVVLLYINMPPAATIDLNARHLQHQPN